MPIATSRFLRNCNATLLEHASREARMSNHTYTYKTQEYNFKAPNAEKGPREMTTRNVGHNKRCGRQDPSRQEAGFQKVTWVVWRAQNQTEAS